MPASWLIRHIGIILVLAFFTAAMPLRAAAQPVFVGYFPAFKGLEPALAASRIDHYTHINIAFANPDANGALTTAGTMTCMSGGRSGNVTLAELREAVTKLRAKGAKVLISTAGGVIPQCSGDWATLMRPNKRDALAKALLALVDDAGFDGLDIDIEGVLLTKIDQEGNYTPFIAMLSKALKARGKLLTVATASYEGGMIPVSSVPYFDLVMPMSYDAIGTSWGVPGSEHSTYAQAERDIALWLARGVKLDRLVLGVPYYGYGFGAHAPAGGYRDLLARHGAAAMEADVIGKACAGCDYVTHNSTATLRRKAELAKSRAGGVMVWEVTQDTDDQLLGRTIHAVLSPASN